MIILLAIFVLLFPPLSIGSGPIYTHKQPEQEEFRILYTDKAEARTTAKIFSASSTPSFVPEKIGDIYINTSTGKVYIATATLTSGSWAILN